MTPTNTLSPNRWAYGPLIALVALMGPDSVTAHEGHGDTAIHAAMHLAENGLFIGLAVVLIFALFVISAVYRMRDRRHRAAKPDHHRSASRSGDHDDSR